MNGRLLTRRALPTLVAALSLGAADAANASTAKVETGTDGRGTLVIEDTVGTEQNLIRIKRLIDLAPVGSRPTNQYLVKDSDGTKPQGYPFGDPPVSIPVTPLEGCFYSTPGKLTEVTCTGDIKAIRVVLAGGFDYFAPLDGTLAVPPASIDGGASDDFLVGTTANDTLIGGAGDDQLNAAEGDDVIDPGEGKDDPIEGGSGEDTVTYASRSDNLNLSIDGASNDGSPTANNSTGEQDRIMPSVENVTGGSGRDVITGSDVANRLTGNGGDDTIWGRAASDVIAGNAGNNTLMGEAGDDTISAAGGNDTARGGDGGDSIDVGDGDNFAYGEAGDDPKLKAGAGKDTIEGGSGNDSLDAGDGTSNVLQGDDGTDTLTAGSGADNAFGGSENDTLSLGNGNNVASGGPGEDTITTGTGNDTIYGGVEGSDLGDGTDTITADSGTNAAGADIVFGQLGDDQVTTGGGGDKLFGHDGNDNLNAGANDDVLQGHQGQDTLTGGDGSDTASYEDKGAAEPVFAQSGSGNYGANCEPVGNPNCENDKISAVENYIGGAGNDHLLGGGAGTATPVDEVNRLEGRGGHDTLEGGAGSDRLIGESGDDDLVGGTGGDHLTGNDGYDQVSYKDAQSGVTVTLDDRTANDGEAGEADNLDFDIEKVEGSRFNDSLTGSDDRNDLYGLAGDDRLEGKKGADVLDGGLGDHDAVTYAGRSSGITVDQDGAADDGNEFDTTTIQTANGPVSFRDNVAESVEDITGTEFNDAITAGATTVANTFVGGKGNDTLDGGLGADQFWGDKLDAARADDTGNDTVVYSGRLATDRVEASLDDEPNDGFKLADGVREGDHLHIDVENIVSTGEEQNVFVGDADANRLSGGAGNDTLAGLQSNDILEGSTGDDVFDGGAGEDLMRGGSGADDFSGAGDSAASETGDTVDYREETRPAGEVVRVTVGPDGAFDDVANDGGASDLSLTRSDNVRDNVEFVVYPAGQDGPRNANTAPQPPSSGGSSGSGSTGTSGSGTSTGTSGSGTSTGSSGTSTGTSGSGTSSNTTGSGTSTSSTTGDSSTGGSSSGDTTTVSPTAEQRSTTATQPTSVRSTSKMVRKGSARSVLVRGRILVRARQGLAKSSAACRSGGKVRVTVTKGRAIVGRRLVTITRTCRFMAPVTLRKGTTGRLKVQVRFLGSRTLKPTKRTTRLQVNG